MCERCRGVGATRFSIGMDIYISGAMNEHWKLRADLAARNFDVQFATKTWTKYSRLYVWTSGFEVVVVDGLW